MGILISKFHAKLLEGHILFGSDAIQIGEREAGCASGNHWSEACTYSLKIIERSIIISVLNTAVRNR